jgi:trimethylamine--corrinoid protein Co-methyltransferase
MIPAVRFLSPEEEELVHQKALWLLANTGFQMLLPEAVDIMRKAGTKVDNENIVKIPPDLVAYAVENSPKRDGFILYGREERYDVHFGKDTPVLCSMRNATHVLDMKTGERRPCTVRDVADMVRLMDALDNISANAPTANPQDVPRQVAEWYALAATLKNTSKPVCGPSAGGRCVRDTIKMASLAAGSEERFRNRPFVYLSILARPPLQMSRLSLEALIEASRQALPVRLSSGPILGVTCPVTLAGALTQSHAEVLAGLVLSQVVRPGAPVIYGNTARGMDMKTGCVAMSSPEFVILKGAAGQMGRYLGLPVCLPALLRDAKIMDAQAGFETGVVGLVSTLSADMVRGMQYDMDTLVDFADFVFSNEAMGALKRIARGSVIQESTLALDVIAGIGHGGSFLNSKHTLKHFREELWMPRLFERRDWAHWEKGGRKDIEQRAREKAKEILSTHQPSRVDHEVESAIDRIVREAANDLAY